MVLAQDSQRITDESLIVTSRSLRHKARGLQGSTFIAEASDKEGGNYSFVIPGFTNTMFKKRFNDCDVKG